MGLELLTSYRPGVQASRPIICLEVNPPRGTDFDSVLDKLDGKIEQVDFFNVTDSALARMRAAPLPFASKLRERFGREPLVNISCRDRNLIALQGDLLAGWASGIQAVIALTGDAVTIGDSPERKGVFEVNSVGLLNAIGTLNSGKDLAGNQLAGAPTFCPGVVVNPNARNMSAEIRRLEKKRTAGARFALSQPVFDLEASRVFFDAASTIGLPILMGLMAFRTVRSARNVVNVPGIKLSSEMSKLIDSSNDESIAKNSLEICLKLANENRKYVAGFHIVSGVAPKLALSLADYIGKELTR